MALAGLKAGLTQSDMPSLARRAFTLVEIMIVVVIIGLLAALAIPAFKKVRNSAIEKSMINDARQISAAVQIYASENAVSDIPVSAIGKSIPLLSSGVILVDEFSNGPWGTSNGDLQSAAYAGISLNANTYFGLIHSGYNPSLSNNPLVSRAAYANGLRFSTESGQIAHW